MQEKFMPKTNAEILTSSLQRIKKFVESNPNTQDAIYRQGTIKTLLLTENIKNPTLNMIINIDQVDGVNNFITYTDYSFDHKGAYFTSQYLFYLNNANVYYCPKDEDGNIYQKKVNCRYNYASVIDTVKQELHIALEFAIPNPVNFNRFINLITPLENKNVWTPTSFGAIRHKAFDEYMKQKYSKSL